MRGVYLIQIEIMGYFFSTEERKEASRLVGLECLLEALNELDEQTHLFLKHHVYQIF